MLEGCSTQPAVTFTDDHAGFPRRAAAAAKARERLTRTDGSAGLLSLGSRRSSREAAARAGGRS
jgi:hypothetical protein